MSWVTIDTTEGHIWELNEETQEFRLDGTIVPGGDGLAEMLNSIGYDVTPEEATSLFASFLALRAPIPPGHDKTAL